MMPFIEKRLEQIKSIEENKNCDYLFCHSDLNGCKMHLTSVANKNADSSMLYVNSSGLMKIEFNYKNLQSKYYLVAKAE